MIENSKIFPRIEREIPIDTKFDPNYRMLGIRESQGEAALYYSIPSNKGKKPSQKSIIRSELELAHQQLLNRGEFTLSWFKGNMPITARASTSCSFKVVGEIFTHFGLAQRVRFGRGHKYMLKKNSGTADAAPPSKSVV